MKNEYSITLVAQPEQNAYDRIVRAVAQHQFRELRLETGRKFSKTGHMPYDLKYLSPCQASDLRL
jgi:UDP-N-acetyl-D-galactosamine dehydrogenase